MSIIHINQIKTRVLKLFSTLIDISDLQKVSPEKRDNLLLTRSIAAYAVLCLTGSTLQDAARSIVAKGNDKGIDALYFDKTNNRLYLVQSTWIKDGNGKPEINNLKKFLGGVRDLLYFRLDNLNDKIKAKIAIITSVLGDPSARYEIVFVHTGLGNLSEHAVNDLADLAEEFNDVSELLFTTVVNQGDLHNYLTKSVINMQIDKDTPVINPVDREPR